MGPPRLRRRDLVERTWRRSAIHPVFVATVLSTDLAAAVGELKAKPGGELQVYGSCALIRWLLDNELVDELTQFLFPVVVGQGTRMFPTAARTERST